MRFARFASGGSSGLTLAVVDATSAAVVERYFDLRELEVETGVLSPLPLDEVTLERLFRRLESELCSA